MTFAPIQGDHIRIPLPKNFQAWFTIKPKWEIVKMPGDGDCALHTLRSAFFSTGKDISCKEMRDLLAERITIESCNNHVLQIEQSCRDGVISRGFSTPYDEEMLCELISWRSELHRDEKNSFLKVNMEVVQPWLQTN
jgi:hypothetical protein